MTTDSRPEFLDGYRLLSQAARLAQHRHDQVLAPLGLTRAAAIAMEGLAPGPLNQEQLATVIHVKSQTIGRVLERLQSAGLVTRTRQPHDRRQLSVGLTDAGRTVLQAARDAQANAFPADFQGWRKLREELTRFVNHLQGSMPPETKPVTPLQQINK
jgi:DNA-binding MarR family transcriptional regulator